METQTSTVEICDGAIRIHNVKILPGDWNGWALPVFTSEQVDELIRQQEELALISGSGYEEMSFFDRQGEVVLEYDMYCYDEMDGPTCHIPAEDGTYGIGTYYWTWEVVQEMTEQQRLILAELHELDREAALDNARQIDNEGNDVRILNDEL